MFRRLFAYGNTAVKLRQETHPKIKRRTNKALSTDLRQQTLRCERNRKKPKFECYGLIATVVNTIGQGEAKCGLGERMRVLKSGGVERAGV